MEIMKTVHVAAAVIRRNGLLLATQRGYGEFRGGWEFPGGKLQPGETAPQALVREIREELDTTVSVDAFLRTVEYDYPAFHLIMDCFWCSLVSGDLILKEHEALRWFRPEEAESIAWLPADRLLLPFLRAAGTEEQP